MPNGTIGNLRLMFKDTMIKRTFDSIQKISFSDVPTVGTFKLKYDSSLTAEIGFNAVAADIKTALEDLAQITEVTVTGSFAAGFTIRFSGLDSDQDKLKFEYDANTLKKTTTDITIDIEFLSRGYDNLGEYKISNPTDTSIKGSIQPVPDAVRINVAEFYDIKSADYTFYTKELLTENNLLVYLGKEYRAKILKNWYGYYEYVFYQRTQS